MSAARTEGGRWLGVYVIAYLVFLYLPVLLIPLFSFNNSIQAAFPLQGFTLEWYATLYGNPALSGALLNSLVIGVVAAAGATLCGITVSYMDLYGRSPLAATISAVARLPILIPGVIVGISLLILVNLIGLGPSRIAIVLSHILVALPTTVVIMRSRFAAIPKTIREAALDLGASDWTTFRRVMLPELLPAVSTGFVLAFARALGEYGSVIFIAGNMPLRSEITPLLIMIKLEQFDYAGATAIALVFLAVSFALLFVINLLSWRRNRKLSASGGGD